MDNKTVVLVGNPNTGKSTIFNALTGAHQHTGNWSGKTVGNARGVMTYRGENYDIIDLPGIYSVNPVSEDERCAVDCIKEGRADIVVIVLDATCLERNLILALEMAKMCSNVIVCVNLMDEAEKKGIIVDVDKLGELLDLPVVGTRAREGRGLNKLRELIYESGQLNYSKNNECLSCCRQCSVEYVYKNCVLNEYNILNNKDRRIDRIVTNKVLGIPIMLGILGIILWITIVGANYPSGFLSSAFNKIEVYLLQLTQNCSSLVRGIFIEGMFRTLSWVVSVMLPPMAIFFPLFAILEDFGYLPRMAFNLDNIFRRAKAHGKMVLSMCMGFGCNAAGVVSTRIIDSPKERLIAILTNNFIPCNGRFSGLITLSAIFVAGGAFSSIKTALIVLFAIILSVFTTLVVSYILSRTVLKGQESYFTLELPPYRTPKFSAVIIRSIREKILYVLGRAVVVAAPAGAIIWLMQNITFEGISLLSYSADFLEPFANFIGLDGYILAAFILGMPANEIVIPIVIMCYTGNSGLIEFESLSDLGRLLAENGWDIKTAVCTMIFSLFHFPCAATLLTIRKETNSIKWTLFAFVLPTVIGILLCIGANFVFNLLT